MVSSTLVILIVIPAIYGLVKGWKLSTTTFALDLGGSADEPLASIAAEEK